MKSSRNLSERAEVQRAWIPACAGMTGNGGDLSEITETHRRHSHESGNLGMKSSRNLSERAEVQRAWIPACAGMTVWKLPEIQKKTETGQDRRLQKQKIKNRNLKSRHSHESGNPEMQR
ncbi:putative phage associated protein [Neisseria lactamica]|uniref:hypothetical protein n=1 Tax=Neisseria lactamica TaxID=486 RepID=UPI000502D12D|nr:hypothetical protein [Neisseria lactamica]KFJ36674.1 hypothetical protein DR91_724 [Neisseria lactamica ATCC 23970]VTQ48593.1 putative phage associated protein [Neisseria lactamica]